LPAAAIRRRPALFTRLSLHLMRRCTEENIPTPRSSKPRLQPPYRRVSGLPSARLWRTSSPPPHRRQRAPGELRVVVLFLPVQTPSQTVHHSSRMPSPARSPAKRLPSPASALPLVIYTPPEPYDLACAVHIKTWCTPWLRSTVDQWTWSTAWSTVPSAARPIRACHVVLNQ
jgi:hypothetical protein